MPTTYDDLPSVPLPDTHHQQVRALLVRQARPTPVRWRVAAFALTAAAVAGAFALGGSQLIGQDAATAPAPEPDCATGLAPGAPADVPDDWRLLPREASVQSVQEVVVHRSDTACGSMPTPLQVLAQIAPDGTITAALTLASDDPRPGGWQDTSTPVTVRGTDGVLMTMDPSSAQTQLYWSEAGRDLSVTAAGIDRAAVLALVESLTADGTNIPTEAYPPGMTRLTGWEDTMPREPVEPVWTVVDEGQRGVVHVEVFRNDVPWEATLTQAVGSSRIIDVGGQTGVLADSGNTWLYYRLPDGAQVSVFTDDTEADPESVLELARTLIPVTADDPRLSPSP